MHEHLLEGRVVGGRERHLIVNASAAVSLRIDQHDDLLKRHIAEGIIDAVYLACGEITCRIEGVVMRIGKRVFPLAVVRDAWSGILRWSCHGYHVKLTFERCKRLTLKDGIGCPLRILVKLIHLILTIAFSHYGEVDAIGTTATF